MAGNSVWYQAKNFLFWNIGVSLVWLLSFQTHATTNSHCLTSLSTKSSVQGYVWGPLGEPRVITSPSKASSTAVQSHSAVYKFVSVKYEHRARSFARRNRRWHYYFNNLKAKRVGFGAPCGKKEHCKQIKLFSCPVDGHFFPVWCHPYCSSVPFTKPLLMFAYVFSEPRFFQSEFRPF